MHICCARENPYEKRCEKWEMAGVWMVLRVKVQVNGVDNQINYLRYSWHKTGSEVFRGSDVK